MYLTRFIKLKLIALVTLLSASTALAGNCGVRETGAMRLYGSYARDDFQFPFLTDEHQVNIAGCGNEVIGKYLAVTLGPSVNGLDPTKVSGFEFSEELQNDYQDIENNPFGSRDSYQERLKFFLKQRAFVQTCVLTQIHDNGRSPLFQPPKQIGCQVKSIDPKTAVYTGSVCFFRFNRDSSFDISYYFNPDCTKREFLKANHLDPMDVRAGLSFSIADTADGAPRSVTPIATREVRVALEPEDGLLSLSENYGQSALRWPDVVAYDAHMGSLSIDQIGSGSTVQQHLYMSMLVNNKCAQTCNQDFCTSACDRPVPVGASVNLYELKANGKRDYVDGWYTAGIANGRWQGFVPAAPRVYNYAFFQPGKTFRLEADMNYLDDYFRLGKEGFAHFLLELPDRFPGVIGRDPLPRLNPFPSFTSRVPHYPTLDPMSHELEPRYDPMQQFWNHLRAIALFFGESDWPPYVKQYCTSQFEKCLNLFEGKLDLRFWAQFTVGDAEQDAEGNLTGRLSIKDIKFGRDSNILSSYVKTGPFPKLVNVDPSLPFQ